MNGIPTSLDFLWSVSGLLDEYDPRKAMLQIPEVNWWDAALEIPIKREIKGHIQYTKMVNFTWQYVLTLMTCKAKKLSLSTSSQSEHSVLYSASTHISSWVGCCILEWSFHLLGVLLTGDSARSGYGIWKLNILKTGIVIETPKPIYTLSSTT